MPMQVTIQLKFTDLDTNKVTTVRVDSQEGIKVDGETLWPADFDLVSEVMRLVREKRNRYPTRKTTA